MAFDVSIYQNNNKDLEVTVTDEEENVVDLTGARLSFKVVDWRNNELIVKDSTNIGPPPDLTITEPVQGKAVVYLYPADTANITPGTYACYMDLFTSGGSKQYTVDTGDFKIFAAAGSYQLVINKIRNLISDKEELNVLTGEEESTDERMMDYIEKAIDYFNNSGYMTSFTIKDYPSLGNLIDGTIIQILIGEGILSARNLLSYNDSGGVQVSDFDKYGRYVNWYNVLINKYVTQVMEIKRSMNIESAYGTVDSEFSEIWDY
jgi:hypothetical protein